MIFAPVFVHIHWKIVVMIISGYRQRMKKMSYIKVNRIIFFFNLRKFSSEIWECYKISINDVMWSFDHFLKKLQEEHFSFETLLHRPSFLRYSFWSGGGLNGTTENLAPGLGEDDFLYVISLLLDSFQQNPLYTDKICSYTYVMVPTENECLYRAVWSISCKDE